MEESIREAIKADLAADECGGNKDNSSFSSTTQKAINSTKKKSDNASYLIQDGHYTPFQ